MNVGMKTLSNEELFEQYLQGREADLPDSPDLALISQLVSQLAQVLQDRKWMLATAESCTGGLIAAACTELAGSSAWFERGFVTYSNAAKTELLGVEAALIEAHGAVSEPVARAMALGALARSHAHIAVAVTGIAGPGGGSADKPVGTVCLGWAWRVGDGVESRAETKWFKGSREAVRRATVGWAVAGLIDLATAL